MIKPDILFRAYWNNDADHDFTSPGEHFCSELLVSDTSEAVREHRISGKRYTSRALLGAAYACQEALKLCKRHNLRLQISLEYDQEHHPGTNSNEMLAPALPDAYIKGRIETLAANIGATNYYYEQVQQQTTKNVAKSSNYTITILGNDEPLTQDLWCRPLAYSYSDYGDSGYQDLSAYGGVINNFKWVKVTDIYGPCWFIEPLTIGEIKQRCPRTPLEFARGELPESHTTSRAALIHKR